MDPDPDPAPFFRNFKDAKKFSYFSYNLPTVTLSSVLKYYFFAKILFSNFILQLLFQSSTQHVYEKREGSGTGSGSGSVPRLMDPDPVPDPDPNTDITNKSLC